MNAVIPSVVLSVLLMGPCLFGQVVPASVQQKAAIVPPPPPLPPVPIDFREFLAMDPAGRQTILATRSAEKGRVLEKGLREYESLPPVEREARLCTLALRSWLPRLMEAPLSNRVERLEEVPQPDRKLVEERLQFWDRLTPEVQQEFLTNQWVLRYITAPPNQPPNLPPYLRIKIEERIKGWNQLSEQNRKEILENFQRLFEFSEKEKAKILNEFSDAERERMQRTLQTFERLPKADRERCVSGFQRFAGLTGPEREQFLSNVELWQNMSPKDRLAWRTLVSRISAPTPPYPPGFNSLLPPAPPPLLPSQPRTPAVVKTNPPVSRSPG